MDLSNLITQLNQCHENRKAGYVLYWMQMFKRTSHNHALNFAIQMANDRGLPLVVYEGLKYNYPWANEPDQLRNRKRDPTLEHPRFGAPASPTSEEHRGRQQDGPGADDGGHDQGGNVRRRPKARYRADPFPGPECHVDGGEPDEQPGPRCDPAEQGRWMDRSDDEVVRRA